MVGRIAHYFLKDHGYKTHRETWCGAGGGLEKEIKTANENRNKIAHYELDFDIISPEIQLRAPRFRPAADNLVDQLIGRIRGDPKHTVSIGTLHQYAYDFYGLAEKIREFEASLILPAPQPESEIAPTSARPTTRKSRSRRSQKKSQPTDDQPSD